MKRLIPILVLPLLLASGCAQQGPHVAITSNHNSTHDICKLNRDVVSGLNEMYRIDSQDSGTSSEGAASLVALKLLIDVSLSDHPDAVLGDTQASQLRWALINAGSCLSNEKLAWLREIQSAAETAGN